MKVFRIIPEFRILRLTFHRNAELGTLILFSVHLRTIDNFIEMGSFMVWEINMGVCPRLEFDNIMFINCLGYDFYIYGAFEFLCNSIANS